MKRWKESAALMLGLWLACPARGVPATFTYTQTNATTGSGSIAPFVYNDGNGPINFASTPMPIPLVWNTASGQYVGSQASAAGAGNEANTAVGLIWSGSVTATGTRGSEVFTIQIPLRFVPKQTQSPDISDYTWSVTYGDNPAGGIDAISSSMRFAMWFSRDDNLDGVETPNTFQRYTQQNHTFVSGQDFFSNTDTITTAIKDAVDGGDPQGSDAAGRNLAFYWGWRDQGALSQGEILVDDFTVGGLLEADELTLTLVPEPSGLLGLGAIAALGLLRRRRV